jgi:SAM-dependent methyltransferase
VSWLVCKAGFELQRCSDCDHVFVSPAPDPLELAAVYADQVAQGSHTRERGAPTGPAHPKFVERVERVRRHLQRGKVLDVGCANGELLNLVRDRGFEVQGVEMNPETAGAARSIGIPVVTGSLEQAAFPDGTFDLVHLGDVIEHVPDVHAFAAEVRRVVRPGGLVIVVTPNHDAFFPRATWALWRWVRIPWSHATPPFHLHQFSTRSLWKLLEAHGLRMVDTWFSPVELPYELQATGLFGELKRAVLARRGLPALRLAFLSSLALVSYPLVWLLDRLKRAKPSDATVNVIAAAQ